MQNSWKRFGSGSVAAIAGLLVLGCSSESTRIALEAQRRADEVQRAVAERQGTGLKALLFRDISARMEAANSREERSSVLNDAWNERDLIEFWALQFERAAALRLAAVDAKLFADQSIVDLMIKQFEARADRAEAGLSSEDDAARGADAPR